MTTYAELQQKVSRTLQDPDNQVFEADVVKDMITAAWAEIGRIAPQRFQEDITPVADTLAYTLRSDDFAPASANVTGEADTELFTSVGHGLSADQAIKFVGLVGGTGLTEGLTYYVSATGLTSDAFQVSLTAGGVVVAFSTDVTDGQWQLIGTGQAVDEIELQRVEIWDGSITPATALRQVEPQSAHPMGLSYSQAGWVCWAGVLELPNRVVDYIDGHEAEYLIRVWGYSPWPPVALDNDVVPFGSDREEALILVCYIEALRRLIANRALFTQWQTRSNNTDVTPAALMNDLNIAQEEWRRKARAIFVLREAP